MTTATKTAPDTAPYKTLLLGDVEITDIVVVRNTRKHFDEKRLEELAQSIRQHGVQAPITLRPMPEGEGYELIAGERRLRASKLAGKAFIPAKVLAVDEAQAEDLRALENLFREDLRPIEEAEAFKNLMAKTGRTAEDLASSLGKSPSYVYRAVALLELPAAVLEAIEADKITPAHGHQLLRLPADKREEWLGNIVSEYDGKVLPASALAKEIDSAVGSDLKKAPWPKDEPFGFYQNAAAPACSTCPSNTGNQGMLFDGVTAGRCLNQACYAAKLGDWGTTLEVRAKTRAEKEDVPYVGAAKPRPDYQHGGSTIKGHAVAESDKLPAKGKRKGYGLAVSLDGIPTIVWVKIKDEKAAAKAEAERPQGKDWEKERFIGAAVDQAIQSERVKLACKFKATRKVYEGVADHFHEHDYSRTKNRDLMAAALGQKELKLSKLTPDQLAGLLALYIDGGVQVPNAKAITAATKKTAAKEYAAQKLAAKPAGKAAPADDQDETVAEEGEAGE